MSPLKPYPITVYLKDPHNRDYVTTLLDLKAAQALNAALRAAREECRRADRALIVHQREAGAWGNQRKHKIEQGRLKANVTRAYKVRDTLRKRIDHDPTVREKARAISAPPWALVKTFTYDRWSRMQGAMLVEMWEEANDWTRQNV